MIEQIIEKMVKSGQLMILEYIKAAFMDKTALLTFADRDLEVPDNLRDRFSGDKCDELMQGFKGKDPEYREGFLHGLMDGLMFISTKSAQVAEDLTGGLDTKNMPENARRAYEKITENEFIIKEMVGIRSSEVKAAKEASLDDVNQKMWDMLEQLEGQDESE
jgi:hypothetical protein